MDGPKIKDKNVNLNQKTLIDLKRQINLKGRVNHCPGFEENQKHQLEEIRSEVVCPLC
jgi:hypothetical protein